MRSLKPIVKPKVESSDVPVVLATDSGSAIAAGSITYIEVGRERRLTRIFNAMTPKSKAIIKKISPKVRVRI